MTAPEKLSITIDNKILLHILAVGHLDGTEEIPITLTQSGMAESLDTPLGSVSRALKKLVDAELLIEKLYHVRGKKRRMSAYFLTLNGEKHILQFREKLIAKTIRFQTIDDKTQNLSISQIISKLGKKANLVDIVNHIGKNEYFDEKIFNQELQKKAKLSDGKGYIVHQIDRMPKPRQFFDRVKEQNYLIKNMKLSKIIVIHGMAGIGKSTLAANFVENHLDSKNIFWYRFQEWDSVRNILVPLGEFLANMNKKKLKYYLESNPSIDYFDIINILISDLHKSNSILVFDDFQRVNDRIIQFFSSITENLDKIDNIFILILSRSLIRFYNRREVTLKNIIQEMRLGGLDREGSVELLKAKALEASSYNQIYDLTKGHPLALELIESMEDLKHPTKDIMRFVHEEIFSRLDQDEKDLLKVISIYRGSVNSDAIFIDESLEYETLDKLLEKALLNEIEPSVYEIHDLIREFFYSRLIPSKRIEYHLKAAKYYQDQARELAFLEAAYHLIKSNSQKEAAQLIIDRAPIVIEKGYHEEVMNVLMSFDHNLDTKYLSQIYKLKGQILDIWGEWDNIFEYYYQCSTLNYYLNKFIDFNLDRGKLHSAIGYMSWNPLEVETALKNLQSSLKVVQDVEDEVGKNEIIRSLGWVYWLKGDHKKAIANYKSSLKGLKDLPINVEEAKANIYINLGNIHWEKQDWDKSIKFFSDSVNIFKKIKNNYKVSRLFNNIGCVYAEKSVLDKALNFFNKGITLSEEVYYIRGKAYTLLHLGECQLRQKHFPDAQKTTENALEIFTKIEDHLGITYSKINLGLIQFFHLNWNKAKEFFLSAVDLLTEMDVPFYLGEVYLGLSIIFSNLNDFELEKEFKNNAENTFNNILKKV